MEIMKTWLDEFCEKRLPHGDVEKLFRSCFMNTIETTVEFPEEGDTYVFTGDIPAMWLRDSSAQLIPYLNLAKEYKEIRAMFSGLLKRQFRYILLDPYANAFNKTANGHGHKDKTKQNDWVWERKYEIDSLCYPLWLACRYYNETKDSEPLGEPFIKALNTVLEVFETEQRHNERSDYSFIREGEYAQDTLPNNGKGDEIPYTGMTWSAFRPSDDRCVYNYLVPSNMFAVVTLRGVAALGKNTVPAAVAKRCVSLADEIDGGVARFGTVNHPDFGKMYVYETDGKGNNLLMDDANVPSLMSLPYIGYCKLDDPVYLNTRKFILSEQNPYYFKGKCASGLGSPHTPKGYIWHIGLLLQGLTARTKEEKREILSALRATHAGTFFMHEGFDKDDPSRFTRPWFSWANSLFAAFIIENQADLADLIA